MSAYTTKDILEKARDYDVKFIRLQFTNIKGALKNIAITVEELERALKGWISTDSSVIEGFTGHREHDIYLLPDPDTFVVFPWRPREGAVARLICDAVDFNGNPSPCCSRSRLREVINDYTRKGWELQVGAEIEFFLFHTDNEGRPTTSTHDTAGYCDLTPVDMGENARRDMVLTLQEMGFDVASSHHEISPGQHEIYLKEDNALAAADSINTFKFVVRTIAQRHGLHATFMPKPLEDYNGSGLHLNYTLWQSGDNLFQGAAGKEYSPLFYSFAGGVLAHAPAVTALTNQLINSYKRLALNDLAPVLAAWSEENRSTMIRCAHDERGPSIVLRSPDPACNPYLALLAGMKAGLDGVNNEINCPDSLSGEEFGAGEIKKLRNKIGLPARLETALEALSGNEVIRGAMGDEIYKLFMTLKEDELERFHARVHPWELEEYLKNF